MTPRNRGNAKIKIGKDFNTQTRDQKGDDLIKSPDVENLDVDITIIITRTYSQEAIGTKVRSMSTISITTTRIEFCMLSPH